MQRTAFAWVTSVSLILGGCFGSGGDGGNKSIGGKRHAGNQAPTISGSPPPSVLPGESYAFQPAAADANGDKLSFTVTNKPAWATFDTASGHLAGTPDAGEVGEHTGITIAVSDGKSSASLPAFYIAVRESADGSVTLSWMPPAENADGSALTDLAGYRIYVGQSIDAMSRVIILHNPGLTRYVVENLSPATWYFAMTSLNGRGKENNRSAVVSKRIA
jgi:hypothetical protein